MKKLLVLLLIPIWSFSQTAKDKQDIIRHTDVSKLKAASARFHKQFEENRNKARMLAKLYQWPLKISKDKTFSELVGVTAQLRPVYYMTFNEGAGITSRANKLYSGGSLGLNINGENMISGVWDAAGARETHQLFSGRVSVEDGTLDTHYHSTHVAGTIMGTNLVQNGAATGMAYKAHADSYDWNDDISEVAAAAAGGLLLSNHSYGRNPYYVEDFEYGKYDEEAQAFDDIMFNAPYYQFVCAAGNSRGNFNLDKNGYDLLTTHALSKNSIVVAAVEEVLQYDDESSVVMSDFSSWGPTDDGRIKPDISAKGVNTFSAVDDSDTSYDYLSGTSMASPSVNGTLLLLQQYYHQKNNVFMRAATLRGLMIHSADEAGLTPGPDYSFGWGLINAEKAANIITKRDFQTYIQENTLLQGETYTIGVNALGDEPLLATICWTDPQGIIHSQAIDDPTPALVNDLDITILQSNDTYRPWKLNPASPAAAATKGDNVVDNVEKIEIPNPSGSYTIRVTHKGTLVNNQQQYSLIISGTTAKDFWITSTDNVKFECDDNSSSTYAFNLHTKSGFSDVVTLSALNLPAGISAAFTAETMTASGDFEVTLSNINSLVPGVYPFTISGISANDSYEIPVALQILSDTFQPLTILAPVNGTMGYPLPASFSWNADLNAQAYEIQIAEDASFANIVQTQSVATNTYTAQGLANGHLYFWRVRGKNSCGTGSFSVAASFSTICSIPSGITLVSAASATSQIGWVDASGAASWEVEVVAANASPTGSGTIVNSNPYTITGLTASTCYKFYVRNLCELGDAAWAGPFDFCTQPDYCAGTHFYDSGGPSGNFQIGENNVTIIRPDQTGERIRAIFNSFDLGECCGYFIVFDGPDTSSPILYYSYFDEMPPSFASSHPEGALTFLFNSSDYQVASGWDATIICEPIPACPTQPTNLHTTNLTLHTANITWEDDASAISWETELLPSGAYPTGIGVSNTTGTVEYTGLTLDTCYDFYVRSVCAAGTSGWSGPFKFCTPPDYCNGSHFYDTGGATGPYQNNEHKVTTIYPDNPGDRIRAVFNTYQLDNWSDFMVIHNGPDETYPVLYEGNYNSPGTVVSTEVNTGALTFVFYSNEYETGNGWDASIICEPMPACPNAPTNLEVTYVSTDFARIGWTDSSNAWSWETEMVPHGMTPTGTGTIINTTLTEFEGLALNSCYDFYVRSICADGTSTWAGPLYFCTQPDYCGGAHFYDSGGATGAYLPYENKTTVIYPENAGDRVRAIFNEFNINNCCDYFAVYDGPSTNAEVLYYNYYGNPPVSFISSHPTGALTFSFQSAYQGGTGWDAVILCEPVSPCATAPANLHLDSISFNEANIGWDNDTNSSSWEIEVLPHGTTPTGSGTMISMNAYSFENLSANTCYDFYVRTFCAAGATDWTGPLQFCTPPDYCGGAHFYDTGGPAGAYNDYENYTKVIYPSTAGERVKAVFNSFQLESCCDYLRIYNGPDATYPLLYNSYQNSNPGTYKATTPTGALTFEFHSDGSATYSGWDATIICEPMPACPNAPTSLSVSNVTTTSAQFTWDDYGTPASWEVEIVPQNGSPAGNGTITQTRPYAVSGLSPGTCYQLYIRSNCTMGNSDWVGPFNFCTTPDYCAGVHFYDSGGATGSYGPNEYKQTVIYPDTAGNRVRAIFNAFQLESCCDYMTIYDGPGTNYPYLYSGNGNLSPGNVVATNPLGALTFLFSSDSSGQYSGWDATIICEPLPDCPNPPGNLIASNVTKTAATVSWLENYNASSWEMQLIPHGAPPAVSGTVVANSQHTFSALSPNTCYDFYVRSLCSDGHTDWAGPLIVCTQPDYCGGNHFYDTGGATGSYQDNEYYVTTIAPDSAGQKVKAVFNYISLESCCDSMSIYNGPTTSSPLLYSGGGYNMPTTFNSTDATGALTFRFASDGSETASGWDATISCITLGTDGSDAFSQLEYYPNPVQERLEIDAKQTVAKYALYSIEGKLIREAEVGMDKFQIEMAGLSSGAYMIRLTNDESEVKVIKVIKN
ncbi:hypothetical protein HYN48_10665 [Flavobacterium magnum]|uniref:Fibronectin type-III domain-containing protein n=1 Tax=Flavobacterium magnum TaxID=2162713 RepID=A0A2S0RFW9_9FLAO|nr:fibronectin type III domain-containing protein [Flavobacterium magnum]AWA30515.1 hypothetical protein HYN48_10665 [Flavobacterium magnum]